MVSAHMSVRMNERMNDRSSESYLVRIIGFVENSTNDGSVRAHFVKVTGPLVDVIIGVCVGIISAVSPVG